MHRVLSQKKQNIKSHREEINITYLNEGGVLIPEFKDNNCLNTVDDVLIHESNLINNEETLLSIIFDALKDIQERLKRLEENQVRILEMKSSDNSISKFTLDNLYTMVKNLHDNRSIIKTTDSKSTTDCEEPNEF
ncbi:uncharacterized protein LOC116852288 [Odontomachus brunneus]|uniref:uncharacterized protein LOC116852288 n=1 Tax=Odontomachus brunneus TaxID=486640 RepID=UPI0013F213B0|nr:uncharacterized protein LOC116852288 [Odontomachus brunneus]